MRSTEGISPCAHGALPGEGTCSCKHSPGAQVAATDTELLEAVIDSLPFYVMLIDESHTVLYANRATREALGIEPEQLVGSYCPTVVHGLPHPFQGCPLEEAAGRHVTVEREFHDESSGGWVSSSVYPAAVRTTDGKTIYAHVVRSINQRKHAEKALRERMEVETLVADVTTRLLSAPPGDLAGQLERALATLAQFMDCSAAALYLEGEAGTQLAREVAWPANGSASMLPATLHLEQQSAATGEVAVKADLRALGLESDVAVVPLSLDGRPAGVALFAGGSSPRLQDDRLLELLGNTFSAACDRLRSARQQQLYAEHLRSLATALAVAEEKERRQLAADLHDSIGQTLALCIMNLSDLESSGGLTGEAGRVVAETRGHIEDALVGAKTLMFDLSPPSLHELGLVGALEGLLERVGPRFDLDWALVHDDSAMALAEDLRVFLFRAVQELVTNVSKHAAAKRVEVKLWQKDGLVTVEVKDDGCGMAPADCCTVAGAVPRFGLFSIRERLNHLGGTISMTSAPGEGTRVTIEMPLQVEGSTGRL